MAPSSLQEPVASAPADSTRTEEVRRTAARLFGESGYSATTMNDIADAVGVLPGSLYHHFSSKEEIAIDLLASFDSALTDLGTSASQRPVTPGQSAEHLVRQLAGEVAELSFSHAAAVRLRAYEAPSIATDQLRAAMQFHPPAFDKAWRTTTGALAKNGVNSKVDLDLLRFALQEITLNAPIYYPSDMDPRDAAARLCDALLDGLARDCPADEDLDNSAASKAAVDAIADWRIPDHSTTLNDREKIIAAARLEFARRGYEATTIREIANAAGVRMGTLYRRVESKESLVKEIIERYASRLDRAFQAVLAAHASGPESLDALARVYVHASRRFSEESRIVKLGWRGREAESSPFHDYYMETQRRLHLLEQLLTRGFEEGTLRPIGEPHDVALDFRSILWLPFRDYGGISETSSHFFLRESLLRGALTKR